jgi:hypothetical protein
VRVLKQTSLKKWFKKESQASFEVKSSSNPPLRVILTTDSSVEDYEDLIAEVQGEKIALYLKQKQIPIYLAKISKDQFFELSNLGDNLSPALLKTILPELDEGLIFSLCQFLLSQRSKQRQLQKDNLFTF